MGAKGLFGWVLVSSYFLYGVCNNPYAPPSCIADIRSGKSVAVKMNSGSHGEQGILEHEAIALRLLRRNSSFEGEQSQRGCPSKRRMEWPRRVPDIIFYGPPGEP